MRPINLTGLLELLHVHTPSARTEREQQIAAHFKSVWPDSAKHLDSFQAKSGCGSCRHQLVEALTANPGKILSFLRLVDPGEQWDLTPLSVQTAQPEEYLQLHKPAATNMRGQVREIDDTPQAYADFYSGLLADRARYAGFAVCPAGPGKVKIYFY